MILKDVFATSVPHIEALSVKKFINVLENFHEYEITEKVDGSQLLFGIDEYGFYTSRETKGGPRVYTEEGYAKTFSSSYMRAAHVALEQALPLMEEAGFNVGDQIEAEVLYGELPNAVPYSSSINQIVFLRVTEGFANLKKISRKLASLCESITIEVPTTYNGKDVVFESEESLWKFGAVQKISVDLKKSLVPVINKIKLAENKAETAAAIAEAKTFLLDNVVRQQRSFYGPSLDQGGWVEGIVLSHPTTKDRCKVVDKEVFTKVRDFIWETRTSLTATPYHIDSVDSFMGEVMVGLGNSIGHAELGTRQAKKYMSKLGETREEILDVLTVSINLPEVKNYWLNFIECKEVALAEQLSKYESTKNNKLLEVATVGKTMQFKYNDIVDRRTKQTFADTFAKLSSLKLSIQESMFAEDLVLLLIERQLGAISDISSLVPELSDTLTADHYRAILTKLKTNYTLDKQAAKAKNMVIGLWKQGNRVSSSYDLALKDLGISLHDII